MLNNENQSMNGIPLTVEVIGPAGAGKSTLIKSIIQANENVFLATKPSLRSARNTPYLARNILSLLPIFLRHPTNSMRLTSRELYWIIYLNGWHHNLGRQTSNDCILNMIDHGPLYMLTSLLEFGPEITQSQNFQKWWDRMFKQWASFLDMIIWLDAPNSMLAKRINTRCTWHPVQEKPKHEMHRFLSHYRISLKRIISLSKAHNNGLRVFHFHTDQETPEQITDKILRACGMQFKDVKLMTVNK